MKRKKASYIIEQIVIILLINYFFLIETGFIYKTHWLPTFAFAMVFFHAGTFLSLFVTIKSNVFTIEKEQLLFSFNFFIYLIFLGLLLYQNCLVQTNDLITYYCVCLYILFNAILFVFEIKACYKKYAASLIINN
jgi:hypothetical protein